MSDQPILEGVLQAILLFVRDIDLYEREPLPYVVAVFALAKTTFASLVSKREATAHRDLRGPVVEESAKDLALLIIAHLAALRRRDLVEFAGVMDGIVYGSAVGFVLYEDIGYGAHHGAEMFNLRRLPPRRSYADRGDLPDREGPGTLPADAPRTNTLFMGTHVLSVGERSAP